MKNENHVAHWLELKYIDWQKAEGGRRTVKDFSRYLNIPQPTLNNYLRGNRRPTGDYLHRLAEKLGSEIYTILGMTEEEAAIHKLLYMFDHLDETRRKALIAQARELLKQQGDNR